MTLTEARDAPRTRGFLRVSSSTMGDVDTSSPRADHEARRESLKIWGVAILIAALGIFVTLQWVGAAPPKKLVLATGPANGNYAKLAVALQSEIPADALEIELRATRGSAENYELLRRGEVDLAFVQGGILDADDASGLEAIGSFGIEPVWVFSRQKVTRLDALRSKRIAIGQEGSGTRPVATRLLELAGVPSDSATRLGLAPAAAATALEKDEIDAAFFVSSASAPIIDRLMRMEGVHLVSLARAFAYSRHAYFLRATALTPGMFDLDDDLPKQRVELVATTTALIAKAGFHDALPPLLLGAAKRQLRYGGLFENEGEFPTTEDLDLPLSEASSRWFTSGQSFLYRLLPFRLAALIDRLKILLLPLITLLFPLVRFAPPVYRWRIRRRIFRWYAVLLDIEGDVREDSNRESNEIAMERLDSLQSEITGIRVPLSYAEELYNLRMHLRQVREDLYRHRRELRESDAVAQSE